MNENPTQSKLKGPVTSPSLLLRVRDANDVDSWEIFANLYGPIIKSFCRSRGFQQSDIDDICQEVLGKVAEAIRNFQYDPQKGRFRSWLATITANKSKDFIKRNAKANVQLVESVDAFASNPDCHEWSTLFTQRVFQAACDRVRTDFEHNTWICFEETWLKNRSPIEVAEQLGIPVHSVYVNKSRVLKRLEKEYVLLCDDYPALG